MEDRQGEKEGKRRNEARIVKARSRSSRRRNKNTGDEGNEQKT